MRFSEAAAAGAAKASVAGYRGGSHNGLKSHRVFAFSDGEGQQGRWKQQGTGYGEGYGVGTG